MGQPALQSERANAEDALDEALARAGDAAPAADTSEATVSRPKTRQFMRTVSPTGRERSLEDSELIVSKTDLKGVITYCNTVFSRIALLPEEDALGAPHSIIRHPDMPRCVFKLLWDTLGSGREIFAYVDNMAANGDNYWVFAHVTPTFNHRGEIIAYHSNRRKPERSAVEKCIPLYAELKAIEDSHSSKTEGCQRALAHVVSMLESRKTTYDEFVFSL